MALNTAVLELDQDVPTRPPAAPAKVPTARRRPPSEIAGLATLLLVTAIAYTWDLSASGYANSFYAAAVEAGTKSWKAFFFGSLDSSSFITVDKPPASLWLMELSGRIFGFSSLSMLIPEALAGVATVALLYAMIRRWYGHKAGLVAGVVAATTPVAALMFRFNNPDALLVLLLAAAAYCTTRALEKASTRWLVLAGAAIGFGFLTKMGQALIVVPGLGLAYLVAAPTHLRRRVWQLTVALAAIVVSAGWWIATVSLWPAGSRPMIDGSPTNSIWNLILEYNGLDRVVSTSGSGGGGSNFSGSTGIFRLFNSLMGGQASWLIPAAAVALVGGLAITRRAPRTDRRRASLIMWGGWLVVTAAVFSFGQGVIHTYYTVALVPAIAALVAIGWGLTAARWHRTWVRGTAAAAVAMTAIWAVTLLDRTPSWNPWLRPVIVVAAAVAVAGLTAGHLVRSLRLRRAVAGFALAAAITASLAGPVAYALQTVGTAHTGSIPSAGPASSAAGAGRGGAPGGPFGPTGATGATTATAGRAGGPGRAATAPSGTAPSGTRSGSASTSQVGGGGQTASVSSALVAALKVDASSYRWVAATDGSQSAASIELATGGEPVMAIGGFNGQGGNITLATFEKYVAAGDIHYYIVSGSSSQGPGGNSTGSSITSWVESHFTAKTVGGTTVYDLTSAR